MILNEKEGVTWLTFNIYNSFQALKAVHSTKIGGVSQGYFTSMNLGFARGDDPEDVMKNYELFSKAIGLPYKNMVLSDQWHHNNILIVDESHQGMGITQKRGFGDVDGLITNLKNIPLVTFYADCVPIYFYDPQKNVIGMAHAGWRGTASAIVLDMLTLFQERFQTRLGDLLIGIGPAICQSCYEVSQDVIAAMSFPYAQGFYSYKGDGKYHIDLKGLNKKILLTAGLTESQIEVTNYCTQCDETLFFSHRRYGNKRGTQIGVMMMGEKDERI